MNRDDIIRMAQEAGAKFDPHWGIAYNVGTATFERFAALVAAAERERIQDLIQRAEEAFAASEQKPVAWYVQFDTGSVKLLSTPVSSFRRAMWESAGKSFTVTPLYTASRQWVGLTDEEVHEAFCYVEYETPNDWNTDPGDWCQQFASYLEAKLREKNNVAVD